MTSLVVRRTIPASAERTFSLWTEPAHVTRWWGPRGATCPEAEIDLRVGGSYRIANRFADGSVVWIRGEYEVIEPPHTLVYTWRIGEEPPERVTVRFEPAGAVTIVTVLHEKIADARIRGEHERGWEACLDGLERVAPAPSPAN